MTKAILFRSSAIAIHVGSLSHSEANSSPFTQLTSFATSNSNF